MFKMKTRQELKEKLIKDIYTLKNDLSRLTRKEYKSISKLINKIERKIEKFYK